MIAPYKLPIQVALMLYESYWIVSSPDAISKLMASFNLCMLILLALVDSGGPGGRRKRAPRLDAIEAN